MDDEREFTHDEMVKYAEDRWTTRRVLVWQGWQENVNPEWKNVVGDSGRFFVDTDGGLWYEADPETCEIENKHLPRWHPSEVIGWLYCVRCGAQGVDPEPQDARVTAPEGDSPAGDDV